MCLHTDHKSIAFEVIKFNFHTQQKKKPFERAHGPPKHGVSLGRWLCLFASGRGRLRTQGFAHYHTSEHLECVWYHFDFEISRKSAENLSTYYICVYTYIYIVWLIFLFLKIPNEISQKSALQAISIGN